MSKWVKLILSVLLVTVLVGGTIPIGSVTASAGFDTIPMVAAGTAFSLALKGNGTVWAWGSNYGNTPTQVSGLSDIVSIAVGGNHFLALKNDGTVLAWGDNSDGQLGIGTNKQSNVPVQVSSLSDVIAIAAGYNHSLALKSNGTVWAWGDNNFCQLGDGTNTARWTPVQVLGLGGITTIVAGGSYSYHSLALRSDGTVWAWGYNNNYQLGDGTNANRWMPVQVSALNGITAIAAGARHSLALKNGTIWAWGNNTYGQVGNYEQNIENHSTPVQVWEDMVGVMSGVTSIAAGSYHSFAIKNDGTAWAWGNNSYKQLGDGSNYATKLAAYQVVGLTGIVAIAGGYRHSLALKNDGTAWAWGLNSSGLLGDGTTTQRPTPVQVVGFNINGSEEDPGGPMLLVSASPASGSTDVPCDLTIEFTFSHSISAVIDGRVKLVKKSNGKIISVELKNHSTNPNVLLVTPIELLEANTEYYVTIDSYSIMGNGNEYFAGMVGTQGYYFSTGKLVELSYEDFTRSWNESLFSSNPNLPSYPGSQKWNELALLSGILSGLAYGGTMGSLTTAYDEIGLNHFYIYNETSSLLNPGYAFGHKTILRNGVETKLVVATFRGTDLTLRNAAQDILTDLSQAIDGINSAAATASNRLDSYLSDWNINPQTAVFLITGHSLGGAMANCVAETLSNKVDNSNVFAFAFSGPKTSFADPLHRVNISNFLSTTDTVAYLGPAILTSYRFGKNYYVSTPWSIGGLFASHALISYLKAIEKMTGTGGDPGVFSVLVQCPVDIEVYDSQNALVGKITNNVVSNNTIVPACVDGDDKWFFLPSDEKFTMKLTSTDTGKMDFTVYRYDFITEEVNATKAYTNVALQNGKRFSSEVGGSFDVPIVQLLVTNNEGTPIATVNTDGKETPLNQKQYFKLWGKITRWEKTPLNWFLLIVCFGWIWMAF